MMNTIAFTRMVTRYRRQAVACLLAVVGTACWPAHAADDDVLQQAINYVLTGTVTPQPAPEIVDRAACIVVVPDPRVKRYIRYYLGRSRLDDPNIDSTYSGRQARYELDVESSSVVVEYLDLDKKTVLTGYRSAQIPLPGNIDDTKKAIQLIASRCKQDSAPKLPF